MILRVIIKNTLSKKRIELGFIKISDTQHIMILLDINVTPVICTYVRWRLFVTGSYYIGQQKIIHVLNVRFYKLEFK